MAKTADWLTLHRAGGVVRINVQETAVINGVERDLPGQDVDVKVGDLPAEVRAAIDAAMDQVTAFLNVPAASPLVSDLRATELRIEQETREAEAIAVGPSKLAPVSDGSTV